MKAIVALLICVVVMVGAHLGGWVNLANLF
jgi:hypothetical protein